MGSCISPNIAKARYGYNALVWEDIRGAEWLARFGSLYQDLLDKKKFRTDLEFAFYKRVEELAQGDDRLWVIIISQNSVDIAGHLGSILGDTAVYILGASNGAGRSTEAAYLANWTAMMHAKENGCSWYDVGGIDAATPASPATKPDWVARKRPSWVRLNWRQKVCAQDGGCSMKRHITGFGGWGSSLSVKTLQAHSVIAFRSTEGFTPPWFFEFRCRR